VDRRATGDGHARLSEPSLVSPEEAGRGVNNTRTDPFTIYITSSNISTINIFRP
jgi:hypothetical protein